MKKIMLIIIMTNLLFSQKVALLVGVGNIPSYLNTDKDIKNIKKLIKPNFNKIITLENKKATYKNLKRTLIYLYHLKKEDTFLFYYSGHGCRAYGGVEEVDGKDEFLALFKMKFDPNNNNTILDDVMLDNELNYHFSKIKAKKILIYDCCHSETMHKSLKKQPHYIKSQERIFNIKKRKNPLFKKAKNRNYIKISACLDSETAEDSKNGGVFTLTLKEAIKKYPNSSLKELIEKTKTLLPKVAKKNNREGNYHPNIEENSLLSKNIKTKGIFVVKPKKRKRETLEEFLKKRSNNFIFKTQTNKTSFKLFEPVYLKSYHKVNNNYLYLIEVKNNRYKLVTKKTLKDCFAIKNKKICNFKELIASNPIGKSNIFLISSQKPLNINQKSFKQSLKWQLKKQPFKVAYLPIKTIK